MHLSLFLLRLPRALSRVTACGALMVCVLCAASGRAAPEPAPASAPPAPVSSSVNAVRDSSTPAPPPAHVPAEVPLASRLLCLPDPSGELDIAGAAAPGQAGAYQPCPVPRDFRAMPRQAGGLWMRFRLKAGENASGMQLDLGGQVPGRAEAWESAGGVAPVPLALAGPDLFSLNSHVSGENEIFVHIDGWPGLWFSPSLRTLPEALNTPERRAHPLLLAALTALLLLCLVRSVTERGDGRLWAGVFTGAALLHALWGVPATPGGTVTPADLPGLLAAGVALMLLPHIGRNIMRTRETSPAADVLLLVLALPGAALAALPLLPGMAWTARLMSLWPLGAVLAFLPGLVLLLRGVAGSGLFTLACAGMAGGSALALWGADGGPTAPLWGQGPLAGVLLAALLLAAAAPRPAFAPTEDAPRRSRRKQDVPETPEALRLDDARPAEALDLPAALRLEEILRGPMDALLREACALDQSLDQAAETFPRPVRPGSIASPGPTEQDLRRARRHTDNLVAAARELAALVGDAPRLARRSETPESRRAPFDLLRLIQQVFADVDKQLEDKNLGLSWYIAPHLGLRYKGDRDRLRFVLTMLLTDAVRATTQGVVSLRVRRADRSANPGHLQFTVADTGAGTPPLRRSSLVLAKAWELASAHGGDLFVDSGPQGVEIRFSLECTALAEDGATPLPVPPREAVTAADTAEPDPCLVILAAPLPVDRQLLAWFLEGQGQTVWEARDAEEAVTLYAHTPAALLVLDGHLPEDDIITAIAAIRVFEGERGLPAVPFLALTLDEPQAERLHQAGCDHSLPLPVVRGEFRAMALHLASPSGVRPRPTIVPHRVPPTRLRSAPRPAEAEATPGFLPLHLPPAAAPAPDSGAEQPSRQPSSPATPPAGLSSGPVPEKLSGKASPQATEATPRPAPPARAETLPPPLAATPGAEDDASAKAHHAPIVQATPAPIAEPAQAVPDAADDADETGPGLRRVARTAPSQGLLIPPAPKKRLGWLAALLKPTPKIAAPADAEEKAASDAEWVGEPMPIGSHDAPPPGGRPAVARQSGSIKTRSADPAQPSWYSPYGDDPECSVGEPMPVPAVRPDEAEPSSPRSGPDIAAEASGMPEAIPAPPKPDDENPPNAEPMALPEEDAPGSVGEGSVEASRNEEMPSGSPVSLCPAPPPSSEIVPEQTENAAENAIPAVKPVFEPVARAPLACAAPAPRREKNKKRNKKSRLDDLPFLSLDPAYTPAHAPGEEKETPTDIPEDASEEDPFPGAARRVIADHAPAAPDADDIMDLTEADMVDSPLLQQVPDLLPSLDAALQRAASALDGRDVWGLSGAADRMADRAAAFGLHALSDLALCLKESAQNGDFATAAQLLPELRAEVDRHRGE